MTKAQRLDYGQSLMTHAMVFQGVNIDENGQPNRWRVENSWGPDAGRDGYYTMTDRWFDRVYLSDRCKPQVPAERGSGSLRSRSRSY